MKVAGDQLCLSPGCFDLRFKHQPDDADVPAHRPGIALFCDVEGAGGGANAQHVQIGGRLPEKGNRLGNADHRRTVRPDAAIHITCALVQGKFRRGKIGRRSRRRQGDIGRLGPAIERQVGLMARLHDVNAARHGVIGRDCQATRGITQKFVAQDSDEFVSQDLVRMLGPEQLSDGAEPTLEARALEDRRAAPDVEVEQFSSTEPQTQSDCENAARGRSSNQIEMVCRALADTFF